MFETSCVQQCFAEYDETHATHLDKCYDGCLDQELMNEDLGNLSTITDQPEDLVPDDEG